MDQLDNECQENQDPEDDDHIRQANGKWARRCHEGTAFLSINNYGYLTKTPSEFSRRKGFRSPLLFHQYG